MTPTQLFADLSPPITTILCEYSYRPMFSVKCQEDQKRPLHE